MVTTEKGLITNFSPGEMSDDEVVDMKTTKNIRWVAKLGSQAYGNVTVGNGCVFVGTNNESRVIRKRKAIGEWSYVWMKKAGRLSGN